MPPVWCVTPDDLLLLLDELGLSGTARAGRAAADTAAAAENHVVGDDLGRGVAAGRCAAGIFDLPARVVNRAVDGLERAAGKAILLIAGHALSTQKTMPLVGPVVGALSATQELTAIVPLLPAPVR